MNEGYAYITSTTACGRHLEMTLGPCSLRRATVNNPTLPIEVGNEDVVFLQSNTRTISDGSLLKLSMHILSAFRESRSSIIYKRPSTAHECCYSLPSNVPNALYAVSCDTYFLPPQQYLSHSMACAYSSRLPR